jgi:hypothetical protein
MKKRSRAGGKPIKALPCKALKLKRGKASKAVTRRGSAPAGPTEVAQLTRELDEARAQQGCDCQRSPDYFEFAGKSRYRP